MAISAGTVAAALTLDTGQFEGALKQSRTLIASLGDSGTTVSDKMKLVGSTMQGIGKTATLGLTAPITAAGTAAVKTFMGFDDAMRQVRATMNASEEDTAKLTAAAKEYGATTSFTASQAANALNYLALAGYDADQAVEALPTVLNLAQAGGMDLAFTSDLVTDSMSALGLGMDELSGFSDQLAVTAQKSNTNISQLGQAILTVGATARGLKGGTVELNAELGILADNGIKGAEGGTHLRNVILALTNPTEEAEKALSKYTKGVYDAQGNMRSLDEVLGELKESMAAMTPAEQDNLISTIFNKTDLAAARALIEGTGARFRELTGSIQESKDAAAEMAATMEGGIGGAFRSLQSAAEGASITFGEALAPTVQKAAEWVTGLVQGFAGLSSQTQSTIATVAALTAAAGPLVLVLGKVVHAVGTIAGALPAIGAALTGPAGWVVLGVAGVTALAVALGNVESSAERAQRKLMQTVDPEELKRYREAVEQGREEVRQQVEITVDPELTYTKQASDLYDEIYAWLTDGEVDTEEQKQGFIDKINALYDGINGEITATEERKKAELKAQLESGEIDYDTYIEKTGQVVEQAETARNRVEELRGSALNYVDTYAGAATSVAASTHEYITGLRDEAEQLAREVDEAAGKIDQARKRNEPTTMEKALDLGDVTSETVGASIGAKQGRYEADKEAIAKEAEETAKAITESWDEAYLEAIEEGDLTKAQEAREKKTEELEALEKAQVQSEHDAWVEYAKNVQEDFQDVMSAFPEQAEQLKDGMRKLDLKREIGDLLNEEELTFAQLSGGLKDFLEEHNFTQDYLESGDPAEQSAKIRAALSTVVSELQQVDAGEIISGLEGTELGNLIAQMLEDETLMGVEGMDLTTAEERLRLLTGSMFESITGSYGEQMQTSGQEAASLFTAAAQEGVEQAAPSVAGAAGNMGSAALEKLKGAGINYNQGKQAATQLGNGLVAGITGAQARVAAAMRELARAGNRAFEEENVINSPSKKYRWYGQMVGEGFALGVDDKVFRAEEAVKRLAGAPTQNASAQSGAGRSGAQYNINFYDSRIESEEDVRNLMRRTAQFGARVNRGHGA